MADAPAIRDLTSIFGLAQVLGGTAIWLFSTAVPVALVEQGRSPTVIGIISAVAFVPVAVLLPVAGAVGSRRSPTRGLGLSYFLLAGLGAGLVAALTADSTSLVALAVFGALVGAAAAFEMTFRQSAVIPIYGEERSVEGLSRTGLYANLTRVTGPAVAAAVLPLFGSRGAFLAAVALWMAAGLTAAPLSRGTQLSAGADAQESSWAVYLRRTSTTVAPGFLASFVLAGMFALTELTLFPILAPAVFGDAEAEGGLTVMLLLVAIGAAVGAVLSARLADRQMTGFAAGLVGLSLALAAFAMVDQPTMALMMSLVVGVPLGFVPTLAVIHLMTTADPADRSRAAALFYVILFGTYAVGGPVSGILADRYSWKAAFLLGAATAMMAAALVTVRQSNRARPVAVVA